MSIKAVVTASKARQECDLILAIRIMSVALHYPPIAMGRSSVDVDEDHVRRS